ncbi:MAG: KilA-N domain-containing protein [Patescibacteria group bacterium]
MNTKKQQKISVKGIQIVIFTRNERNYISLTDIARYKNADEPKDIVKNWLRTRNTIEFLGIWEKLHNPAFKGVEFDAFKNESGSNSFVLSPQKWIEKTQAIGIISKMGRYGGGTYAHIDIAYEFASWISAEFKLFLIKEFQRLKEEENLRLALGWDLKRNLAKINYRIHTDAVKAHLVPNSLPKNKINIVYANEADVLNIALLGMTAKDWRDKNPSKEGNLRDYVNVTQLVVLSNLEGINAELIRQGLSQPNRLIQLNQIAIIQMRSLLSSSGIKKLK